MKKKKAILTIVTVLLVVLTSVFFPLTGTLSAETLTTGTCELVNIDRDTKGDWIGIYGSEGYIIQAVSDINRIPEYASVKYLNSGGSAPNHHVWWQESTMGENLHTMQREGALYLDPDRADRSAGCYYDGSILYLDIDIGSNIKYVSVYSLDYDSQSRVMDITVYDESGGVLVETTRLSGFGEGAYLNFKVSGKIRIEYVNLTSGQNSVVSGVFFDGTEEALFMEDALIEDTTAEEVSGAGFLQTINKGTLAFSLLLLASAGCLIEWIIEKRKNNITVNS